MGMVMGLNGEVLSALYCPLGSKEWLCSSCKDVSIICAVVEVQCLNSAEQFDEVDNNASPHVVHCGLYSMQMWEE